MTVASAKAEAAEKILPYEIWFSVVKWGYDRELQRKSCEYTAECLHSNHNEVIQLVLWFSLFIIIS